MHEKISRFRVHAEAVLADKYYKLGQITALSILTIGRGPECLHPAIARAMLQLKLPEVIENIEDAFITHDLEEISKGNYYPLFDANISTIGASVADLQRTFVLTKIVLTKFSAIKQFTDGISSLCNDLTSTTFYEVISTYLCTNNITISFDEMVKQFSYTQLQVLEKGSNEYSKAQDLIANLNCFCPK